MTSPTDPTSGPHEDEFGAPAVDIDIASYLPEGVELADDGPAAEEEQIDGESGEGERGEPGDDGESDSGEQAERADRLEDGFEAEDGDEDGDEVEGGDGDEDEVDTRLLEKIESELDEVEAALAAIDAGDERETPLLRRLLGGP